MRSITSVLPIEIEYNDREGIKKTNDIFSLLYFAAAVIIDYTISHQSRVIDLDMNFWFKAGWKDEDETKPGKNTI